MRHAFPCISALVIAAIGVAALAEPPPDSPAPAPAPTPAPASTPTIPAPTPATSPAPAPASAPAQPVDPEDIPEIMVQLRDGRRFVGPVVRQNESEIVLSISGIPMRFSADEIERSEPLAPLMVRYRELREAVGSDPNQIVGLAEWLQMREKYELALTEVDRALSIDKTNAAALKLRAMLREQILLRFNRVKKDAAPAPHAVPAPPAAQRAHDFPFLSDPDIALIKVYEINFEEHPRVIIPRVAVQKMLDKYASHPLVPIMREGREAILRQTPTEQLDLMFKLQAREFYSSVEVLDQPKAFGVFRDQICHNWLINSCATNACHGGTEAGRLVLFNGSPNAPRSLYTNFLILSRYRLADGTPLLDFDDPERSPVLQFGLARDKSRRPHPVAPRGINQHDGWKAVFRSTDDPQFTAAVSWIKSLYRPRPDYPITYTPLKPFELPKPPPPAAPAPPAPATNPVPDATAPAPQPANPAPAPPLPPPTQGSPPDATPSSAPPTEKKPEPTPR